MWSKRKKRIEHKVEKETGPDNGGSYSWQSSDFVFNGLGNNLSMITNTFDMV